MEESAVILAPDEEVRDSVTDALEEEGLQVTTLESEEEFYEHLASEGYPDLVVLSSQPEKGGDHRAILMGLQASERRPAAVVVTTISARDEAAILVRMGAYASVVFPLDEDELRAVCRRALRQVGRRRELRSLHDDAEDFRSLLYSVFTHLFEGVVVVDPDAIVQFTNKFGARVLTQERPDLVNDKLDPNFAEGFLRGLHTAQNSSDGCAERRVVVGSGVYAIPMQTRAVFIRDVSGRGVGGMVVFEPFEEIPTDPEELEKERLEAKQVRGEEAS